jgi:hypothetical protein
MSALRYMLLNTLNWMTMHIFGCPCLQHCSLIAGVLLSMLLGATPM